MNHAQQQLLQAACKALGKDVMHTAIEEAAEYAAENSDQWWVEARYRDMLVAVDGVEP